MSVDLDAIARRHDRDYDGFGGEAAEDVGELLAEHDRLRAERDEAVERAMVKAEWAEHHKSQNDDLREGLRSLLPSHSAFCATVECNCPDDVKAARALLDEETT